MQTVYRYEHANPFVPFSVGVADIVQLIRYATSHPPSTRGREACQAAYQRTFVLFAFATKLGLLTNPLLTITVSK